MGFRRDEKGRPVGLDWPDPPATPVEPKPRKKQTSNYKRIGRTPGQNTGRPRQDLCNKGLHKMDEHGVQIFDKNGNPKGRYCLPCKVAYKQEKRAEAKKNAGA